ncbi:hypothetical protein THAOC_02439 [Thalassiosira oceanica]|uniref:25S rRNA (uridine-N(3))-methyltransferase BMT5-like domain-containing protein n=1 Tax=Thalassiosira oceanica TaxID=159749 RepID=K0TQC9_THAOC|nr:hypothetical protein THAOC_02439 [Thalassiosira oceanica]|eukprot:EJK75827.1 hypothetical protein THAOC_02439 [Thalassiosira oceanica]
MQHVRRLAAVWKSVEDLDYRSPHFQIPDSASVTADGWSPRRMTSDRWLLLGEGDFTYSLDVCRYLAKAQMADDESTDALTSLTATGIDSRDELRAKYRDCDHTLRGIVACGVHDRMETKVLHQINAVQVDANSIPISYDRVMFHHPHLGREDAQLHSRLMKHLFHAVSNRWLGHRGLFYLTLVKGQYERWDCAEAASRSKFALLRRGEFNPPPAPEPGQNTYYVLRRHQSGRSFASRRRMLGQESTSQGDSETLVFYRCGDFAGTTQTEDFGMLPWEKMKPKGGRKLDLILAWKARKRSKKKRKMKGGEFSETCTPVTDSASTAGPLVCSLCESRGQPRVFDSRQALEAHQRAKHGENQSIKPDWTRDGHERRSRVAPEGPQTSTGHCPICDLTFWSEEDRLCHETEFTPTPTTSSPGGDHGVQTCSFCSKPFRDIRARLQHENFCSKALPRIED